MPTPYSKSRPKNEWVTGKRDYFYAQIQWQMHVTGFRRALLVIVSFTTDATPAPRSSRTSTSNGSTGTNT